MALTRGALVIGLFLAMACRPTGDQKLASPERPHVLLISLDTLRADRLGSYGHDRPTSPFLDELARGGTRFAQTYVNTHGTPPSHATLFSSLYQESHGVSLDTQSGQANHHLPEGLPILPQVLREAGWHTIAVTGGGYMSSDFGWDRGFDAFIEEGLEDGADYLLRAIGKHGRSSAGRGSENQGAQPIFAFFHTYEIHSPYDPPASHRELWGELTSPIEATSEALKARSKRKPLALEEAERESLLKLYDAGIRHTDDVLRRLFGKLEEIGFLDHALVVVTSDHGEEFGEHGSLLHPATLYDELVAVPLIFSGPGVHQGRIDQRIVSTLDIAPTIYGYLDVRPPRLASGLDLLSQSSPGRKQVYMQYGDLLHGLRTPRFKLIENRRTGDIRLYDLQNDPREKRDLSKHRPLLMEDFTARLEAWRASQPRLESIRSPLVDVSDERLEELRALGYVD